MGVDFGIVETGSLVLFTSNPVERLLSCLPEVFVGVVYTGRLVPSLSSIHGYASQALKDGKCVSIITGPSRTADIEQRFVRGVHGPQKVYVLVVAGGAPT
jgi:L-lactate dehydrogenase complex protein LldG